MMTRTILISILTLLLIGCNKEEVNKDEEYSTGVTPTDHLIITFNSYSEGDYIKVGGASVYLIRERDSIYYPCNISNNLHTIKTINDCEDGYLELYGVDPIVVEYEGDLTLEYL